MSAIVAIVGRPNVGKSTLFNRLTGSRTAIVENEPGITRDRLAAEADWNGRTFTLFDTGGMSSGDAKDVIEQETRRQVEAAIAEADVLLLVLDGQTGVHPDDEILVAKLRRSGKPVLVAVNKSESPRVREQAIEFYALGLGEPIPISAEHGMGTGDLLDAICDALPPMDEDDVFVEEAEEEHVVRVAIIGRPNVGKSTLFNALTGKQRSIVSDVAGTTRDTIDEEILFENGLRIRLIDTAGMRRRSRVDESVEYYSVLRALRAVDRADVVLMLLDATDGPTEQDKKIVGYGHNKGKASILLVNKWDAYEDKDAKSTQEFEERVRREISFLEYAPILFVSAKTGQRLHRIPQVIEAVAENHRRSIPTGPLNRLLEEAQALHPAPSDRGRPLKIYYATQGGVRPPTFLLFVNNTQRTHFSYLRYLENQLRSAYDFTGTPIRLVPKARRREHTS